MLSRGYADICDSIWKKLYTIALFWGLFDRIFGSAIGNPVGAGSPTIFEENRQVKSTRPHPTISLRVGGFINTPDLNYGYG
jgi:hypothetical protein